MTIIQLLTEVNSSYLLALSVLIYLAIEGIKQTQIISNQWLPLIASLIGLIFGVLISWVYQEAVGITSLNGVIAGLLAAGVFDCQKTLWKYMVGFDD